MPGSDTESDVNQNNTTTAFHQLSLTNSNAKFPYLKKEEYDLWAMKMHNWMTNVDYHLWKVILKGNSPKRTAVDEDGRMYHLDPSSAEEILAVQRENKARTILLQAIPDEHMGNIHNLQDAKDIWLAIKARFGGSDESRRMRKSMLKQQFQEFQISEEEGMHKGYDRFQRILSQLHQLKAKPDNEDCNSKFLRSLPSSWLQVSIALKAKGGLDNLTFDDLYNRLKSLEPDVRTHTRPQTPSYSAFVSSTSNKVSHDTSPGSSTSSSSYVPTRPKAQPKSSGIMEDIVHSFVADYEDQQQLAYEDFDQVDPLDMEEMNLKWQMAMLSMQVRKFENKSGRKIDFRGRELNGSFFKGMQR